MEHLLNIKEATHLSNKVIPLNKEDINNKGAIPLNSKVTPNNKVVTPLNRVDINNKEAILHNNKEATLLNKVGHHLKEEGHLSKEDMAVLLFQVC